MTEPIEFGGRTIPPERVQGYAIWFNWRWNGSITWSVPDDDPLHGDPIDVATGDFPDLPAALGFLTEIERRVNSARKGGDQ